MRLKDVVWIMVAAIAVFTVLVLAAAISVRYATSQYPLSPFQRRTFEGKGVLHFLGKMGGEPLSILQCCRPHRGTNRAPVQVNMRFWGS